MTREGPAVPDDPLTAEMQAGARGPPESTQPLSGEAGDRDSPAPRSRLAAGLLDLKAVNNGTRFCTGRGVPVVNPRTFGKPRPAPTATAQGYCVGVTRFTWESHSARDLNVTRVRFGGGVGALLTTRWAPPFRDKHPPSCLPVSRAPAALLGEVASMGG